MHNIVLAAVLSNFLFASEIDHTKKSEEIIEKAVVVRALHHEKAVPKRPYLVTEFNSPQPRALDSLSRGTIDTRPFQTQSCECNVKVQRFSPGTFNHSGYKNEYISYEIIWRRRVF